MARSNLARCEQLSRAGKACRNTVSFKAEPTKPSNGTRTLLVCGAHANSMSFEGWRITDFDPKGPA